MRSARVGAQRAQQPEAVERRASSRRSDQIGRRRAAPLPAPPRRRRTRLDRQRLLAGSRARSRACRRCRRRPARCARARRRRRGAAGGGRPALAGSQRSASSTNGAAAPPASPAGARAPPTRSAGRCALPSGIDTVNVVPSPTALSTRIVAAVQPHQLVHQRQADARALVGARARALDAVEALEQARQLVLRDADAGVRDRQLDAVAARRAASRAIAAVERELERVRQQVEDDLLPHVAVDEDRLAQRRARRPAKLEPAALDRRAEARSPGPRSARPDPSAA